MIKKNLRVAIDILMFFTLCLVIGSGLLIHYRLLPGYRGGHGMILCGMSRHEWGTLHLYLSFFLIFLTLIHLILNYAFIKNTIANGRILVIALLTLIGMLLIAVFLLWPIEKRDASQPRELKKRHNRGTTLSMPHISGFTRYSEPALARTQV
jgi:hypothetical protein